MIDILFNESGLEGTGESTQVHQREILVQHKGWNKFHPQRGVGIDSYIDDDVSAEELKGNIQSEFEADGMTFKELVVTEEGEISINAKYKG